MGDYFNTEYVLAFDKQQVVHAINKMEGSGGKELIEKIIQLPFEIPSITQQDLEPIFADRLNDVLVEVPEDAWNNEYWAEMYYSSLKYFFTNCRDITRYVNALNFSYPRVKDVVNPVDFFALTALEIFTPDVYFGIRDNKDLFTDLLDNVYELNADERQKDRLRCDEIIARQTRISKDILLHLLIKLFPRLRRIYEPEIPAYHSDAIARKLKRLCSPDLFDAYFRLSLTPSHLPETEFKAILSIAEDPVQFDQALSRLNQDERVIKFLDHLDEKTLVKIPRDYSQAIVSALIDNGDLFPQGASGPLSLDTPMKIHRIIHVLMHRFSDSASRFNLLQKAIGNASKSIYISVHELNEQSREHLAEEDTFLPLEFRDLAPDELSALKKLTASRIENWASTQRLADHPRLLALLYAWLNWGDANKTREFVKKLTDSDRGLIAFLQATLDKAISQAMISYEMSPTWELFLNDIEVFIPANDLVPHAKTLFEDNYFEKLREREQLALMIFLDLVKADTKKVIPKTSG